MKKAIFVGTLVVFLFLFFIIEGFSNLQNKKEIETAVTNEFYSEFYQELYNHSLAFSDEEGTYLYQEKEGIEISEQEFSLISKIVWAESRGESFEGKIAVAAVILNRVKSERFPNTIEGVIFQPRQFCPTRSSGFLKIKPCKDSKAAVEAALLKEDPSKGATFFLNKKISNSTWFDRRLTFTTRVGDHWFYKY